MLGSAKPLPVPEPARADMGSLLLKSVPKQEETYLDQFRQGQKELAGWGHPWLDQVRREAIARFAGLGFPTTHREEWKYTNVAPLARIPFRPAGYVLNGLTQEKLSRFLLSDPGSSCLVFVNGHWCPGFSSLEELPQGVYVGSLAAILENNPARVEEHLARYGAFQEHAFVALNTAFLNDGAFVEISPGLVFEKPIHLLFISTVSDTATVTHPRNLILAGPGTQATIIESYVSLEDGVYMTNAVTEVVVGENAVITHCKLQEESRQAFHIATLQVQQARNSTFASHSISLGGGLVRNEINAVLGGEGIHCELNGLYAVNGSQHVDNHTLIDHAQPHCTSHELYKGILDDKASGVFNGSIVVRQDAQKTNAIQRNKNLLLSKDALINTKPQLEILADDVRCTHGATVGQVDQEAIFYLRSRGIDEEAARRVLIHAFAREVIERIKVEALVTLLEERLSAHLSTYHKTREMV